MRAEQIAENFPVVGADADALDAVRLIADQRLPGLLITDEDGRPWQILPASQVVRLLVPAYVLDDPALAGVLSEITADKIADKLRGKSVAQVMPPSPPGLVTVKADDTLVEVAALMAKEHSPLVAVVDGDRLLGVITAARVLQAALELR